MHWSPHSYSGAPSDYAKRTGSRPVSLSLHMRGSRAPAILLASLRSFPPSPSHRAMDYKTTDAQLEHASSEDKGSLEGGNAIGRAEGTHIRVTPEDVSRCGSSFVVSSMFANSAPIL